jgi:hypothetical protein
MLRLDENGLESGEKRVKFILVGFSAIQKRCKESCGTYL